ncbi:HDIG domain-containing metalloprotein [Blattabacterium cuenoti]|uniref:HDIG domain-containing metalloprotein n=1 Tax=Blattabacterium cuenoti TaxID=1653831 RepID=UPI00163B961C|nr:HDIG domain-containing metalloprotein [Blattabacterium cuenoti]
MYSFLKKFSTYNNKKNISYKILVTVIIVLSLTFFFPKKEIFKYEFYKGKIWYYEDLFSPFNFIVLKSKKDINLEIKNLKKSQKIFYNKNEKIFQRVIKIIHNNSFLRKKENKHYYKIIFRLLNIIYKYGYLKYQYFPSINSRNKIFLLKKNNETIAISYNKIFTYKKVNNIIEKHFLDRKKNEKKIKKLLKRIIAPNFFYNKKYTDNYFYKKIKNISKIKHSFGKGKIIIKKNKVIDDEKFYILSSLKKEYENKIWNKNKNIYLKIGYFLIISIIFLIFLLYFFYFQNKIFHKNREFNFLITSIFFTSIITIFILKYNSRILYIIPFSILPISVRSFYNFDVSIIIHLTTILLLSLITPNSLEFILLQIITGFLVLLTNKNISKMENLFVSVVKIIITYSITFISLTFIRKGTIENIPLQTFYLFFFSGIFTLFVHPLIFIFEKLLNITSDISLLELSNMNNPILRLLSQKAPGTLQHVLTVANIAEEAAVAIEANSLLVRIGAIYHDIGKIKKSVFFIENQNNLLNPHEKLSPIESVKIILEHVSIGVKLAEKYHLPNRITDFIKTHHGDSTIQFFYEKQKKINAKVDKKQFQYPGPKPFSKETAIVMIADSVEAASKSIKNPSNKDLENLVENIINKQKKENQFSDTDITLKEIEKIKKVIKEKLISIYHPRIEYPR